MKNPRLVFVMIASFVVGCIAGYVSRLDSFSMRYYSPDSGMDYRIPEFDVSRDEDFLRYYRISRGNRLSAAAFILAVEVLCQYSRNSKFGYLSLVYDNSADKWEIPPIGYMYNLRTQLDEISEYECRRIAEKFCRFAKDDLEILRECDPQLASDLMSMYEYKLEDYRDASRILKAIGGICCQVAKSDEFEESLGCLNVGEREAVVKFHRSIYGYWCEYQRNGFPK